MEIVRRFMGAINRGDLDAALEDADPSFEYDFSRSIGTRPGVYGLEELRQFWDEFAGMWQSSRWEVGELIEVGEHIVTPMTGYHRGRQGVEVQVRGTAWVWTFRDGKIARVTFYQERQEALEAAGLTE